MQMGAMQGAFPEEYKSFKFQFMELFVFTRRDTPPGVSAGYQRVFFADTPGGVSLRYYLKLHDKLEFTRYCDNVTFTH